MNGLLILISVLAFSANSVMTRLFQIKVQRKKHSINLYQALFCTVAAIAYLAVAINQNENLSASILPWAVVFGGCFSIAVLFSARCMEMGYMSVSSVVINLSLVLPLMFSWTVMGEQVILRDITGLCLVIVTLVLSSASTVGDKKENVKKWLLFVGTAFLANGGSAITQKQYKAGQGEDSIMLFMSASYAVSAVIFFFTYLVKNKKSGIPFNEQTKSPILLGLLALISGLASFVGNGLLGYLCDKVDGGVLYPCINGGLSVAVAVFSFVVFKEKAETRKLSAIAIGICAIIILNLPKF